MKNYLFYVEGLEQEIWQEAESEKEARKIVWNSLDSYEQNNVIQIECLDVEEA